MAAKPRILNLGPNAEVQLPDDVLEALDLEPGGQLKLFVDTRRKQIRLERHVEDAWGEALKKKPEKGFEDLVSEQKARDAAASELFDNRLKEPPEKRKPEDDPDYWR